MNTNSTEAINGDLGKSLHSRKVAEDTGLPTGLIPSKGRLVQLFVLLVVVVSLNYRMFGFFGNNLEWLIGLSVLLIIEVAVISRVCGYSNDPAWMKWAILVWIFTLLNLQLTTMAPWAGGFQNALPVNAMYAAQYGLVLTWLVMGTNHIGNRVAGSFLMLCGLIFASSHLFRYVWFTIISSYLIALVFNLLLFRILGFRMQRFRSLEAEGIQPTQFALKDMLIITTVFALLMGVIKSQELPVVQSIIVVFKDSSLVFYAVGCASAIVVVVACWCALGEGKLLWRYGLSFLLAIAVGVGISMWMVSLDQKFKAGTLKSGNWYVWRMAEARWHWLAWYSISGAMLVASLVFFRSQGLRFARAQSEAK